jgi:hypothetical protein
MAGVEFLCSAAGAAAAPDRQSAGRHDKTEARGHRNRDDDALGAHAVVVVVAVGRCTKQKGRAGRLTICNTITGLHVSANPSLYFVIT